MGKPRLSWISKLDKKSKLKREFEKNWKTNRGEVEK